MIGFNIKFTAFRYNFCSLQLVSSLLHLGSQIVFSLWKMPLVHTYQKEKIKKKKKKEAEGDAPSNS